MVNYESKIPKKEGNGHGLSMPMARKQFEGKHKYVLLRDKCSFTLCSNSSKSPVLVFLASSHLHSASPYMGTSRYLKRISKAKARLKDQFASMNALQVQGSTVPTPIDPALTHTEPHPHPHPHPRPLPCPDAPSTPMTTRTVTVTSLTPRCRTPTPFPPCPHF